MTVEYLRRRERSKTEKYIRSLRENKVISILKKYELYDHTNILDIGASDCSLAKLIHKKCPGVSVTSLDGSLESLTYHNDKDLDKVAANARSLPFVDSYFDAVVLVSTFKHIGNSHLALDEFDRVLKKECYLLIIEPSWWVIKLGARFNYFDLVHAPNVWKIKKYKEIENNHNFKFIDGFHFGPFDNSLIGKTGLELFQFVLFRKEKK